MRTADHRMMLSVFAIVGFCAFPMVAWAQTSTPQASISRVDLLPDRPSPYALRNWKQTAVDFDRLAFDLNAKGQYLPSVWRVPHVSNLTVPGFGMPSYVGGEDSRGKPGEAIGALGAILGATAVGIDKRRWVELTPQYFNPREGTVLNNVDGSSGSSFWYELLPGLTFTQLASRYPDWERGRVISQRIADAWIGGIDKLHGDFDHTSYDFIRGKPVDNKQWTEPDAAAGVAYLELFQALRTHQAKYLVAAHQALASMQERDTNPTYEVLTAYGAVTAAFLNAEKGERWDVTRFVNWCFNPTSPTRSGWGMIAGKWGGYDVGGLMGSTSDGGGYAFAMNTFVNAATLAPIARYDSRFSAPLAKWLLNLSNASRLFYRDVLPADHQSSFDWKGDPNASIAYEALRRTWDGKSPYASGDAKRSGWAKEDFGLYGGGYVGLLAALVHPTDVPMILRIDLRATDFLPAKAYPTDLIWNPYDSVKTIHVNLGTDEVRPYDAVSHRFLTVRPTKGQFALRLHSKQSVQLIRVPSEGRIVLEGNKTSVLGVAIDFNNGRVPISPIKPRPRHDASLPVRVSRVAEDGVVDWSKSGTIPLTGGEGSTMKADVQFAWNDQFLFFRIQQNSPATQTIEAPSLAELQKHWWDFEDVVLSFDAGRESFAVANVPELTLAWNSHGARNVCFSPDLEGVQVSTTGTASEADRTISGKIAWKAFYRAIGAHVPLSQIVRPGSKIGCQPMMVDGTFRRQAYVGGARFTRPSGFDSNSRTLVLEER